MFSLTVSSLLLFSSLELTLLSSLQISVDRDIDVGSKLRYMDEVKRWFLSW